MNKQQLARKIFAHADVMRKSTIETNEYKDYILGFIFYKFLSDSQLKFLKENSFNDDEIKNSSEDDKSAVEFIQNGLGYFISYKDLFSTWISMGRDFNISNVSTALSAFDRLISKTHTKVFKSIFDTLQAGLNKLGDNDSSRTKATNELIHLINEIPMNGKQDYDVLGFIYEYLIGMFAANAGKKAGEFYTPYEVSLLMSEIVASHSKHKKEIKIYDPTSGSGSLLINIGKAISKHAGNRNNIKYYAQEIKQNTYNLTRMNLVMRNISPDNIVTRNADTLEHDWPYFDENDPARTYDPLYVDAVVSNPPYSQRWDTTNKENDPRYKKFGVAPKTKADFAFLLHDLYHVKPDGIMTIILPHGVLFRGGSEGEIRKNLIESNHIDTIIGLPANIFFGTGIPTIIMVLKQRRDTDNILIIDASKGFIKDGNSNKLRSSDIKKIVDTVVERKSIEGYSLVVSREAIQKNDYNLNIPRYVDSFGNTEKWDIYASMFGGMPVNEIDELNEYWQAFPSLKDTVFTKSKTPYVDIAVDDIKSTISGHTDIAHFQDKYRSTFSKLKDYLKSELIDKMDKIDIPKEEDILSSYIFERLSSIALVDKYRAYQLLDDEWGIISADLEMISTEGFNATKQVDPNMVIKKRDGKDEEVQEGYIGHIIPFELVQETILKKETEQLKLKENRLIEIISEYDEILESLQDEEKDILNEDNNAFDKKEVTNKLNNITEDIETDEIIILKDYLSLLDNGANKDDKVTFQKSNKKVKWKDIEAKPDGTYSKKAIMNYILSIQSAYSFVEDSYESKVARVYSLIQEEKRLKSEIKKDSDALHTLTKTTIEGLSDSQVLSLLELKWIEPLVTKISAMPTDIINVLVAKIEELSKKYKDTYEEIESEIKETEEALSSLIDELDGSKFDMKGLNEFKSLLKGG